MTHRLGTDPIPGILTAMLALAFGAACQSAPPRDDPAIDGGLSDAASESDGQLEPEDAGIAIDSAVAIDAEPADAGDGCAMPPTGDWVGSARKVSNSSGSTTEHDAEVRWIRVSTAACLDRFQASGTVTTSHYSHVGNEKGEPRPIAPTDGELVIDRNAVPVSYDMRGQTGPTWWADHQGTFDGAVISGGHINEDSAEGFISWRFVRADAVFTPPSDGCSEAHTDSWTGVFEGDDIVADVTWTRVATEGCVDRFTPAGVARRPPHQNGECALASYQPDSAPIVADQGELLIDRSTDPATFTVTGHARWTAVRTCTQSDGSSETGNPDQHGGNWAHYRGAFDGDRFSGLMDRQEREAWSFAR